MKKESVKEQIERLRKEINEHDYRYYALAMPQVSDREYDALMKELQDLEEAHPEYPHKNGILMGFGHPWSFALGVIVALPLFWIFFNYVPLWREKMRLAARSTL